MLAALASFGVMVSVMNLTGYVVVEHHHHSQDSVFPIIGAHVFGMYALVLVIGALIDRVGRTPALEVGLVVMAFSTIGLLWVSSVFATAVLLLGLGLGWNISFVAATAQLADRTSPAERGKLLGFNDLLGALFGAGLALLGGYALDAIGVGALAIGATAIVVAPIFLIARTQAGPHRARAGMTTAHTDGVGGRRSRCRARGHGLQQRSSAAGPTAPTRHYHSEPDLKPPLVQILKRTRHTTPGYIFIAPKKDVVQAGPLILDNRRPGGLVHDRWTRTA